MSNEIRYTTGGLKVLPEGKMPDEVGITPSQKWIPESEIDSKKYKLATEEENKRLREIDSCNPVIRKNFEKLLELKDKPLFWFLKKYENDPLTSFLYQCPQERILANVQSARGRTVLSFGVNGPEVKLAYSTEASKPSEKLNEDALLIYPIGNNRMLIGVLDGASSQKEIDGLKEYGVSGAFYISHLAAYGFVNSEEYKNLIKEENVNADEVMRVMNSWLRVQLEKIPGVDYSDVLTVPGMAATLAVIDYNNGKISLAHVADTIAVADKENGYEVLTDNKNDRFDKETMDLVKTIAKGPPKISIREAAMDSRVRQHLKDSFRKKINTPGGCGILNGMKELIDNNLIFTKEIKMNDLISLHIASDGVYGAFGVSIEGSGTEEDPKMNIMLGALEQNRIGVEDTVEMVEDRLNIDDNFAKIPRLKRKDDASLITINFSKRRNTGRNWRNQAMSNLFQPGR